ncbi:aminotransferase [Candidatus Gastranaerophilales bacterium]|nr:MAG: aminotransferase [Candidatus Gastranaerophilales bacterium]
MKDKTLLMIPGPTPVPENVLLEMAKSPVPHRSSEFSAIFDEVNENLKWIFQTKNDVFIFASSGTGAMEAALSNIVNPGDKVLSLVIGNFGERWAKIAESHGAIAERLSVPYGEVINPADLKKRLDEDVNKEIKIVTLTQSETSTGAVNDVKALCKIISEHGALSVVDGVTSVGAIDIKPDEWKIDVLVSGSQKGFMIPPGLAFLTASDKAFEVHKQCKYPGFYFNWSAYKKSLAQHTTPYTPAVNLVIALHSALKMLKEEGLENVLARHKSNAMLLRNSLRQMGLKLFVEDDSKASYAVTSVYPPEGVSVPDIRRILKDDYDIIVANGQNDLKDKIFRIGTLGFVSERDILTVVGALKAVIEKLKV